MLLAIKEAAVTSSLVLPHVLRLQLRESGYKRVENEAYWFSPSARARKGLAPHIVLSSYMRLADV
jgi:hypothetical protein